MNSELKFGYESYIQKFINNINSSMDKPQLLLLWKKIASSNLEEEIKTGADNCPAFIKSGAKKGQICGANLHAGDQYCKRHNPNKTPAAKKPAGARSTSGENKEEDEAGTAEIRSTSASRYVFHESDLSNVLLYTPFRKGWLHLETNLYLKKSPASGNYRVYGIVEDGQLMQIEEDEQVLENIEYKQH